MSLEPLTLEACGTEFVNRLDGNGWTRQGLPVSFEMAYLLNEVTADRAEMTRLKLELASRYDAEIVGMAEAASSGALEPGVPMSKARPKVEKLKVWLFAFQTDGHGAMVFTALSPAHAKRGMKTIRKENPDCAFSTTECIELVILRDKP